MLKNMFVILSDYEKSHNNIQKDQRYTPSLKNTIA